MSKEEAKEMLKYPNLRVTEGQVFKYAADWCLKNTDSEAAAEAEFQEEFQNIIDYGNVETQATGGKASNQAKLRKMGAKK